MGFRELLGWLFLESGVPGYGMGALYPFPIYCPMYLFHWAVPELYPFIVN